MILASLVHTVGDTTRWVVDYSCYLDNTATIQSVTITSSSISCMVQPSPTIAGYQVIFFLTGGTVGESVTVSVQMHDSFNEIKNDTISFQVVAA